MIYYYQFCTYNVIAKNGLRNLTLSFSSTVPSSVLRHSPTRSTTMALKYPSALRRPTPSGQRSSSFLLSPYSLSSPSRYFSFFTASSPKISWRTPLLSHRIPRTQVTLVTSYDIESKLFSCLVRSCYHSSSASYPSKH